MFSQLISGNFTNRVYCRDLFVSDFVDFKDPQVARLVDDAMCGSSNEQLLQELMSSTAFSEVSKAVSLSYELDYTATLDTIEQSK